MITWVDIANLLIAAAALVVTIFIYSLGRRLTFRQQRERVRELTKEAWRILTPIRTQGLNSKVILMNVGRYRHGYDGSNGATWLGYAFEGHEIIEIKHGGIEFITGGGFDTWYNEQGHRTRAQTPLKAPAALTVGHVPWDWIEHIQSEGDEFGGDPIIFVRFRAPGRAPFNYLTYVDSQPRPMGPTNRDWYPPLPELGTRRPKFFADWTGFIVKVWLPETKWGRHWRERRLRRLRGID